MAIEHNKLVKVGNENQVDDLMKFFRRLDKINEMKSLKKTGILNRLGIKQSKFDELRDMNNPNIESI